MAIEKSGKHGTATLFHTPSEDDSSDSNFFTTREEWGGSSTDNSRTLPLIRLHTESETHGTHSSPTSPLQENDDETDEPSSDEDENGKSAADRYEQAMASISASRLQYLQLPSSRPLLPRDYFSRPISSERQSHTSHQPTPSPNSFHSFGHSDVPDTIEEESEEGSTPDRRTIAITSPHLLFAQASLRHSTETQEHMHAVQPIEVTDSKVSKIATLEGTSEGATSSPPAIDPQESPRMVSLPLRTLPPVGDRLPERPSQSSLSTGSRRSLVSSVSNESSPKGASWRSFFRSASPRTSLLPISLRSSPPRPPTRASSLSQKAKAGDVPTSNNASSRASPPVRRSSWRYRVFPSASPTDPIDYGGDSALGLVNAALPVQSTPIVEEKHQHEVKLPVDRQGSALDPNSVDKAPLAGPVVSVTWPRMHKSKNSVNSMDRSSEDTTTTSSQFNSLRRKPRFKQETLAEAKSQYNRLEPLGKRPTLKEIWKSDDLNAVDDRTERAADTTRAPSRKRSSSFSGVGSPREEPASAMPRFFRRRLSSHVQKWRGGTQLQTSTIPRWYSHSSPLSQNHPPSAGTVEYRPPPPTRPLSVVVGPFDLRLSGSIKRARHKSLPSPLAGPSLSPVHPGRTSLHLASRDSRRRSYRASVDLGVGMGIPMHLSVAAGCGWNEVISDIGADAEEDGQEDEMMGDEEDAKLQQELSRQRTLELLTSQYPRMTRKAVIPRSSPGQRMPMLRSMLLPPLADGEMRCARNVLLAWNCTQVNSCEGSGQLPLCRSFHGQHRRCGAGWYLITPHLAPRLYPPMPELEC